MNIDSPARQKVSTAKWALSLELPKLPEALEPLELPDLPGALEPPEPPKLSEPLDLLDLPEALELPEQPPTLCVETGVGIFRCPSPQPTLEVRLRNLRAQSGWMDPKAEGKPRRKTYIDVYSRMSMSADELVRLRKLPHDLSCKRFHVWVGTSMTRTARHG